MGNQAIKIYTYEDAIEAFIQAGHKIKSFCFIRRDLFSVLGTLVKIGDFKIQIYEYPDETSRKREVEAAVRLRLFSKERERSLADEVHCWSVGLLNILYHGSDRETIRKIKGIFGPPYHGVDKLPIPQTRYSNYAFKK